MVQNCRILTKVNVTLSNNRYRWSSYGINTDKAFGLVSNLDAIGEIKDAVYTKIFEGTRENVKEQSCKYALEILQDYI